MVYGEMVVVVDSSGGWWKMDGGEGEALVVNSSGGWVGRGGAGGRCWGAWWWWTGWGGWRRCIDVGSANKSGRRREREAGVKIPTVI
jgi:hypothetical protein